MGCDIVIGTAKRLNEIYLANGLNSRDLLIYGIDNAEKIVKAEVVIQLDKLTDRMPKCQHILIIPEFSNTALEQAAVRLDSCYQLLKANKLDWDEAVNTFSNDETTMQNSGIITNPMIQSGMWAEEDFFFVKVVKTNIQKNSIYVQMTKFIA